MSAKLHLKVPDLHTYVGIPHIQQIIIIMYVILALAFNVMGNLNLSSIKFDL